ncbi:uncharacterized protein [Watersipora subatra]
MKIQQPNKLIIYYWKNQPILRDNNDYNLWYAQLSSEYYNIVTKSLGEEAPDCSDDDTMTKHVTDVLANGGIYVNDTIILLKHLHGLRSKSLTAAVDDITKPVVYTNLAFLIAKKGEATLENLKKLRSNITCASSDALEKLTHIPNGLQCVHLLKNIIPAQVMETKDALSQVTRLVHYGSTAPKVPLWSMENPIENIGHMVLLGGWEMNLLTYLSIRSMIHCVGVDAMYIYIDQEPKGQWYEKLKAEEPLAVFVYREWPSRVFGQSISDGSHASDLLRFDLMYRFGGIYVDWDAIMLRPLGHLRGYGFVTNFDWPDWHPPYPDVINNGVSAGKKGSEFLRKSLMKFRDYEPNGDWYYMGLMMPYKLYEQYPELVKIERRLQVICFNFKCHPVFLPGYHNEKINHLNGASFNWKEVYAFHWTRPSPPELLNMTSLLTTKSMFADVGRYVLSCKREETLQKIKEDTSLS